MTKPTELPLPNLPDDATLSQWAEAAIELGHNEGIVQIVKLAAEGTISLGDCMTAAGAIRDRLNLGEKK